MSADRAFDFFEIVRVVKCAFDPSLLGAIGYINGKAYEDDTPELVEGYSAALFGREDTICFDADQLESLGYFVASEVDERGYTQVVFKE